ncbi:hypothetical protein [Paraherbaspirillum soli]|uniref:Uncharacterized protein n=1 Tax=Paraherbaspirillum soli TaxID=631222 RepID=A0ABW0M3T5_9BURK
MKLYAIKELFNMVKQIGKTWLILPLFFFGFITKSQGEGPMLKPNEIVAHGVIFTAQSTAKFSEKYSLIDIRPPYWTPSTSEIEYLEEVLNGYLKNSDSKSSNEISQRLFEYKRQYLGYTDKGSHWVYINGFCNAYWKKNDSWHSELVVTFDGGPCFFQVRYNVEKKLFERLEINGEG